MKKINTKNILGIALSTSLLLGYAHNTHTRDWAWSCADKETQQLAIKRLIAQPLVIAASTSLGYIASSYATIPLIGNVVSQLIGTGIGLLLGNGLTEAWIKKTTDADDLDGVTVSDIFFDGLTVTSLTAGAIGTIAALGTFAYNKIV